MNDDYQLKSIIERGAKGGCDLGHNSSAGTRLRRRASGFGPKSCDLTPPLLGGLQNRREWGNLEDHEANG